MGNKPKSEVVEQRQLLEAQKISGADLWEKFRKASREDVRLAVALQGFANGEIMGAADYQAYLRRRIRPAVLALLEENRVLELAQLDQLVGFTADQIDDFLPQAIAANRPEIIVWLLKQKESRYGFHDRDLSL